MHHSVLSKRFISTISAIYAIYKKGILLHSHSITCSCILLLLLSFRRQKSIAIHWLLIWSGLGVRMQCTQPLRLWKLEVQRLRLMEVLTSISNMPLSPSKYFIEFSMKQLLLHSDNGWYLIRWTITVNEINSILENRINFLLYWHKAQFHWQNQFDLVLDLGSPADTWFSW